MRQRKVLQLVLATSLLLVAFVCVWSLGRWVLWLAYPTPENRQPRSMFTEWGSSDWGEGWGIASRYGDDFDVWVRADTILNILVVFATGDSSERWGGISLSFEQAILRKDTPYETIVKKQSNILIWIGPDCRRELGMDSNVSVEVIEVVKRWRSNPDQRHDLLGTLLRLYRGPDREQLEKLIETYRAGSP